MKKKFLLIVGFVLTCVFINAAEGFTYAVSGITGISSGTAIESVAGVKLIYGGEADAANSITQTFSFSSNAQTFSGVAYSGYISGDQNPKIDGGSSGNVDNLPNTGTYFKFEVSQKGQLEFGYVLNPSKPFYIVDVSGSGNVGIVDGAALAEKAYTDTTIDVEAGHSYYVWCNGSKLGFYGFTFYPSNESSYTGGWVTDSTFVPNDDYVYLIFSSKKEYWSQTTSLYTVYDNGKDLDPQDGLTETDTTNAKYLWVVDKSDSGYTFQNLETKNYIGGNNISDYGAVYTGDSAYVFNVPNASTWAEKGSSKTTSESGNYYAGYMPFGIVFGEKSGTIAKGDYWRKMLLTRADCVNFFYGVPKKNVYAGLLSGAIAKADIILARTISEDTTEAFNYVPGLFDALNTANTSAKTTLADSLWTDCKTAYEALSSSIAVFDTSYTMPEGQYLIKIGAQYVSVLPSDSSFALVDTSSEATVFIGSKVNGKAVVNYGQAFLSAGGIVTASTALSVIVDNGLVTFLDGADTVKILGASSYGVEKVVIPTAPSVKSFNPADGATNLKYTTDTTVTITFDQAIQILDTSKVTVNGKVTDLSVDDKILNIVVKNPVIKTKYTITVDSGAIANEVFDTLISSTCGFSFTTYSPYLRDAQTMATDFFSDMNVGYAIFGEAGTSYDNGGVLKDGIQLSCTENDSLFNKCSNRQSSFWIPELIEGTTDTYSLKNFKTGKYLSWNVADSTLAVVEIVPGSSKYAISGIDGISSGSSVSEDGVKLIFGGEADAENSINQTFKYGSNPKTFSGIEYSGYISGDQNPKINGGSSGNADNLPNTGTYYKFEVSKTGNLEFGYVLNPGKSFYIVDVSESGNKAIIDGQTISEKAYTDITIPVEAGHSYYVWCNGSKLGLYGFSFKVVIPGWQFSSAISGWQTFFNMWPVVDDDSPLYNTFVNSNSLSLVSAEAVATEYCTFNANKVTGFTPAGVNANGEYYSKIFSRAGGTAFVDAGELTFGNITDVSVSNQEFLITKEEEGEYTIKSRITGKYLVNVVDTVGGSVSFLPEEEIGEGNKYWTIFYNSAKGSNTYYTIWSSSLAMAGASDVGILLDKSNNSNRSTRGCMLGFVESTSLISTGGKTVAAISATTASSITLAWNDNKYAENYIVKLSDTCYIDNTNNDAKYIVDSICSVIDTVSTLSFKFTELTVNKPYYMSVTPITANNVNGDESEVVSGMPKPLNEFVPAAPTVESFGVDTISLLWYANEEATAYSLTYWTKPDASDKKSVNVGNVLTYKIENLLASDTVNICMQVIGGDLTSKYSDTIEVITLPYSFYKISGITSKTTSTTIKLNWSALYDAASYNVYYSTSIGELNSSNPVNVALSECTLEGLTKNTLYYFKIQAIDSKGALSTISNIAFATTLLVSIEDVNSSEVKVLSDKFIRILNAEGKPVSVLSVSGAKVAEIAAAGADESVYVTSGLYIVVVDNKMYKVIVK